MSGPRASSCADAALEKYLISTVTVPPTNTKHGQTPRLARVEAASANQARGVDIRVEGTLRLTEGSAEAPTVQFRSMDLGKSPARFTFNRDAANAGIKNTIGNIFNGGSGSAADIIRNIRGAVQETTTLNSFARIPRFGVKRTKYEVSDGEFLNDSDWLGVSTNFEPFPTASYHNEIASGFSGVTGPFTVHGRPRLLETKDGKLQLWHLAKKSTGEFDLIVSQFDPKTQTEFTQLSSLKASYGSFVDEIAKPESSISYYPVGIAPVTLGDSIYCVVCVTNHDVSSNYRSVGFLYTFQLTSTGIEPVAWSASDSTSTPEPRGVPLVDLFAPGTADQSGTNQIDPTAVFGGIDAVEMDGMVRVAVGVKCSGYCGFGDATQQRTIIYLDTPDFNSWGDSDFGGNSRISPIPRIMSISDFAKASNIKVNDIYRDTTLSAYVCGPDGSIHRTFGNGSSWFRLNTGIEPENMKDGRRIDLHAIHGYNGVIYAAGDYGTIIRSDDFGDTWKVIRTKLQSSEFLFSQTTAGSSSTAPVSYYSEGAKVGSGGAIYGLYVKQTGSGETLWACGQGGIVAYCADASLATPTWVDIVEWNGSGSALNANLAVGNYYSIVNYSSDNIIVVGDGNVHNAAGVSSLAHRESRALRITSATTAKDYATLAVGSNFQLPISGSGETYGAGGNALVRIRKYLGTGTTVTIDASGHVYFGNTSGVLSYYHSIPSGTSGIVRDIECNDGSSANNLTNNQIIALEEVSGGKSVLWYTLRLDAVSDSDAATKYRQLVVNGAGARAISFKDLDVGFVGGQFGVATRTTTLPQRARPALLRLPSGATMMVNLNLNTGEVEHHEFQDNNAAPRKLGAATINTQIPDSMEGVDGEFDETIAMGSFAPTPSLTISDSLEVLMCWGNSREGITDSSPVALPSDNYSSWQKGTSPLLHLPLGQFPVIDDYTQIKINATRDTKSFSRGRLFSTCVNVAADKIGVFVARDFRDPTEANPTNYVPIIPGKWQWSGINDMMVKYSGLPAPGDEFTAAPVWSYSTTNLTVESPSVEWRSALSGGGLVPEVELIWDRYDNDVVAALGVGFYWDAVACALFNKNFQQFWFGVSDDNVTYAEVYSDQIIQSGTATSYDGSSITSVLKDAASSMVPSQYKLGAGKRYFLKVTSGTGTGNVYEIVDNGRQNIFFKNTTPLGTSFGYQIFSDRAFADLTAGISDDQRYTARYVRIVIPSQKTVDGYFKLGTPIIGNYVTYSPYSGNESRRKYSEGFGWKPIPSSILQRGESGVSSIEHLGFQRSWTLPYEQMQWWDRDMQMNGLLPAMRQAFAIQFAPDDDNQLYLVRLNDGPQVVNTVQDRYSYSYQLEEVV